jgi:hypothetical protein
MMLSDIAKVRAELAGVREALLAPGPAAVESCIPRLEEAIRLLKELQTELPPAETLALRRELNTVVRLAANGAAFWRNWRRVLGLNPEVEAGYDASGTAAVLPVTGTLRVEG